MNDHIEPPTAVTLLDIVRPWPIAESLSSNLPTGDLVSLSRASTALRASLHGFGLAEALPDTADDGLVRESINVGLHGTTYWQLLKDSSRHVCSSKTHTKGDKVHACRLCSTLICEACIVRASFARGKEDTFRNRCRFFCEQCWNNGNHSRSGKHPLLPRESPRSWQDSSEPDSDQDVFCACTLKEHGWLCLECKDKQNYGAVSNDRFQCHGQGCSNPVGPDHEKRRVCLWCDRTLPRHLGITRQAWNQKIMEARARNALSRQADLEEYNRRRLKMMRMSRREMRGDDAVRGDPDADKPQFVRHLDSCCNYRNHMGGDCVPDGNAVYNSKRGYWTYSRAFLLRIGSNCKRSRQLRHNEKARTLTWPGTSVFTRTNRQYQMELDHLTKYRSLADDGRTIVAVSGMDIDPVITVARAAQWVALKTRILDMAFIQRLKFFQIQATLQLDHDFDLPWDEFEIMLNLWHLTPLWEDTEQGVAGKFGWKMREPKRVVKFRNSTTPSSLIEAKIERQAARIIERFVQAGCVLPLRTNDAFEAAFEWYGSPFLGDSVPMPDVYHQPLPCDTSDDEESNGKTALALLRGRLKRSASLKRENDDFVLSDTAGTNRRTFEMALESMRRRLDRRDPGSSAAVPAVDPTADTGAEYSGLADRPAENITGPVGYTAAGTTNRRIARPEAQVDGSRSLTSSNSTPDSRSDRDDDDGGATLKSSRSNEEEESGHDNLRSQPSVLTADDAHDEWEIVPPAGDPLPFNAQH
jgi:hypothetical protein